MDILDIFEAYCWLYIILSSSHHIFIVLSVLSLKEPVGAWQDQWCCSRKPGQREGECRRVSMYSFLLFEVWGRLSIRWFLVFGLSLPERPPNSYTTEGPREAERATWNNFANELLTWYEFFVYFLSFLEFIALASLGLPCAKCSSFQDELMLRAE